MERSASAEGDPSPVSPLSRRSTLSHKGRGCSALPGANYCAIEIGEKSMNQLLGCTTPVTFELIARGPTS